MPAIEELRIRTILDSRGNATVEVDVRAGGVVGRAAAPSGASTGTHEVAAWPKGGVDEAVRLFRKEIAAKLKGMDAAEQEGVDETLHTIDGTAKFARIGGDVSPPTSLPGVKAAAASARKPLFAYLRPDRPFPFPPRHVICGGGP